MLTHAGVVILLLPVLLVLLWHLCNRGLPNDDAANYTYTAVQIAGQFDHGIVPGAIALVGLRGWRPTAFPPMAVPFLLLTGGDVVAACAALQILVYTALAFYLYGFALACSATRLRAAAVGAFVVSLPAIVTLHVTFFSESVWLLFAVACGYHLVRSNGFGNRAHALVAGIWGGLMAAIRPAESAVVLTSLLCFGIWAAIRAKQVSRTEAFRSVALFAFPLVLLVFSTWIKSVNRLEIWPLCLVAVVLALRGARRDNPALLCFLAGLTVTTCLWWTDYMPALFDWVQTTSFGKMAQITDQRAAVHPVQTLIAVASAYGRIQLATIAVWFAVLGIASLIRRNSANRAQPSDGNVPGPVRTLLYASAAALGLFGTLYASSGTGDPRRILVPLVLLIIPALAVGARRSRICTAALCCFAAIHCGILAAAVSSAPLPSLFSRFGYVPLPHRLADGNIEAASALARYVPDRARVAIYTMALFQPNARIYEPAALNVACLRSGHGFETGYLWDTADYDETLDRLGKSGYRFLLLDTLPTTAPSVSGMPYVRFTAELLRRLHAGLVPSSNLRLVARFPLGGREQVLFRFTPKTPVLGDNMAASMNGATALASEEQKGYAAVNLNDSTDAAWGSPEGKTDVYAAIVLPSPRLVHHVLLRLFTPAGRPHLHNIRIVAADADASGKPQWRFLRGRLTGANTFEELLTIPPLADLSEVTIEIDPKSAAGPHTIWGIACLRSRGDLPNYLAVGTGLYVRELGLN